MARTEGRNQPDLLNVLSKKEKDPGSSRAPAPVAPAPTSTRSIHPVLPVSMPARQSAQKPAGKRDTLIIAVLGVLVVGVGVALAVRHYMKSNPQPAPVVTPPVTRATPTAHRPGPGLTAPPAAQPVAAPVPPRVQPALSSPGGVPVYTPGNARAFHTLVLATYGGGKETQARETCEYLKSKSRDYADLFLYRTANSQQIMICLGHFDANRNPLKDPKASALYTSFERLTNASGVREFEGRYFSKLTTAQP